MNSLLRVKLLDIRIGVYQFSPGIFTTLVTAGLLYTMVSMGLWQWNKGEYRADLEQKIESRKDISPVPLHLLPEMEDDRRYLPVIMTGSFDGTHQFLHDNRIVKSVAGYHVYTPFQTDSGSTVLVNRGWLPLKRTRQELPDVSVTDEQLTITGLVDRIPERGVLLGEGLHESVSWPMMLQYLDEDELSDMIGQEVEPMIVWLGAESEQVYYHEYPALDLDSEKNTGYAFQWFAMTLALSIIYIVVNTRKIRE